jgi:hypothetical protein
MRATVAARSERQEKQQKQAAWQGGIQAQARRFKTKRFRGYAIK